MRHVSSAIFSMLLLFFVLTSCENKTPGPFGKESLINFSNPVAGQKAYFQRYTSNCDNLNGNFVLTGDTLEVELIREQGQFYLEEKFIEDSPLYQEGNTNPLRHKISFKEDYALIPERFGSALFFFYGNDTIHIRPTLKEPMTQNGCRIDLNNEIFIGNEIGNINRFEIGPLIETNKTVVACVPIGLGIDAYLIYDENTLLMSHVIDFEGSITGWSFME